METPTLFEPYKWNDGHLNNRVVIAPMPRSRSNNEGNVATELTALTTSNVNRRHNINPSNALRKIDLKFPLSKKGYSCTVEEIMTKVKG